MVASAAAPQQQRQRRRQRQHHPIRLLVLPLLLSLLLAGLLPASPAAAAKKPSSPNKKQQRKDLPTGVTGKVLQLDDANFDAETRPPWALPILFSVGAQWCPHCVALDPAMTELAQSLAAEGQNVRVGKIDGPRNRALMARLGVTGFPSLFYVRDGQCWRYPSRQGRTVEAMREFALEGYQRLEPLPFHKSPVSSFGRVVGRALALPSKVGTRLASLRDEGWTELQLVALAMAVPVVLGGVAICALDVVHTRRARAAAAAAWRHEHGE
jgi:thiol-disulfide isomerase/thioredoxin